MKYYPMYLDLKGRMVLVIGGGAVALQKVPALLASGARVRLVAPSVLEEIEKFSQEDRLDWRCRLYEPSDLDGVSLVIAATDDASLQKKIATDARARKIWVNVVDAPSLCDFIAPAVISRGDLQIAISTGGASPALAKRLRQKLERLIDAEYAELVRIIQRYRPVILKLPKTKKETLWETLLSPDFLGRIKTRGPLSAEKQLKEWLYGTSAV